MRCPAGHLFDGKYSEKCPKCSPGADGSRMSRPGGPIPGMPGMPPGLATRLGGILGPGR